MDAGESLKKPEPYMEGSATALPEDQQLIPGETQQNYLGCSETAISTWVSGPLPIDSATVYSSESVVPEPVLGHRLVSCPQHVSHGQNFFTLKGRYMGPF